MAAWALFVVPPCAPGGEVAALAAAGATVAVVAATASHAYLGMRRSGVVALPLWTGLDMTAAPGLVAAGVLATPERHRGPVLRAPI